MRPTFGTLIPFALFNNVENAASEIKDEVERAFGKQLRLLSLQNTAVEHNIYNNSLEVTVTYALPNQEVNKTIVGFVIARGPLPIYEELL
jgi:F420-0:gamma-glutamyl ligase-like protein